MEHIDSIIDKQKIFYSEGKTRSVAYRLDHLKQLKKVLRANEKEVFKALKEDLGKCEFEAYTSEIGLVYHEISTFTRKLKKWARTKRTKSPLYSFPSKSYIQKQPFGQILIIGPFNFSFQLIMMPMIGAIAAGNTAVLKPSEKATSTSTIIAKIVAEAFDEGHVNVVSGGLEIGKYLSQKRWGLIFFTGSTFVGKIIAETAAKNLTPVILELGGKNPVIVDKDAKLKNASKKITWGKLLNAGQSCVAPDTLYVHSSVKDKFVELLKKDFENFISNTKESNEYTKIIDDASVKRLQNLLNGENICFGGKKEGRHLEPTIVCDAKADSAIMNQEIFGPILSIQTFDELDELISNLKLKEEPLALYYFSENKRSQKRVLNETSSGDTGINEVVLHFVNNRLPFGGVGNSGIGVYHGKHSFDAFSQTRSIVKSTTLFDFPFRYAPYKKLHYKVLRFLIK